MHISKSKINEIVVYFFVIINLHQIQFQVFTHADVQVEGIRWLHSRWKNHYDFLNCSCGQFISERRYVDGANIKDAEFPWLVGILSERGSPNTPLCYGALISDRHILTASSCVFKKKRHQISVYFYGRDVYRRKRRSVLDIAIHDEYRELNHDNNLAIVTLVVPLKLEKIRNNVIAPICILNPFLFSGRLDKMKGIMTKKQDYKAALVGDSKYYFGSVPVKIYGIRNKQCSNIYSERPNDKTLCFDGHRKPACYGAEGSPLSITVSETGQFPVTVGGRYYVLGVYSKGYGCDGYQKGKSGVDVSTNVLNHTDWLIRKTRDGYFCS